MGPIDLKSLNLKKYTYIGLGWISFGMGVIGIFLPLLPTVMFWIIAVWLWSKGSPELVQKVYDHPKYGEAVSIFMQHGIVCRGAKVAAITSMAISYTILQLAAKPSFAVGLGVAVILLTISIWLISRPENLKN